MVDSTDSKAAIAKENSAATTTATVAAMELESTGNAAEAAASETTAVAAVAEAATRVEASATQSVNSNSAQSPQTPSRKRSIESVAVADGIADASAASSSAAAAAGDANASPVTATATTAGIEEPSGAAEPPAKKQAVAVAMAVPATVSQEDQKAPVETEQSLPGQTQSQSQSQQLQHQQGQPLAQQQPLQHQGLQQHPRHTAPELPPPTTPAATSTPTGSGGASSSSSSKAYKGLRHFSMMVCKKVEEKGTTTYNEVADELVMHTIAERARSGSGGVRKGGDEKNIRRRVYDALNVLMAMDIITKNKKAISWKGLPCSAEQDVEMLCRERDFRAQEVQRKREALKELLTQQVCLRNLVEHNRRHEREQQALNNPAMHNNNGNRSTANGGPLANDEQKIPLPFIIVNTHSSAVIQCNMSRSLTDVMFDFSQPFEINDDNTILKRLGMHRTSMQVLEEMLPDELLKYCQEYRLLDSILGVGSLYHQQQPVAH